MPVVLSQGPDLRVKSGWSRPSHCIRATTTASRLECEEETRSELLRGWTANSRMEELWKGLDRGHGETWKLDPVQQRGNRGVRDRAARRTP